MGEREAVRYVERQSYKEGAYKNAVSEGRKGLLRNQEVGDKPVVILCLDVLALSAAGQGQHARAVRLLAAASAMGEASGVPATLDDEAEEWDQTLQAARSLLGEPQAAAAWQHGRSMSIEQIVADALVDDEPALGSGDVSRALTRREEEVAALVGRGHSNRQVAQSLVISERTAEAHVSSALSKLGLTSRTQLAIWAAEHARVSAP